MLGHREQLAVQKVCWAQFRPIVEQMIETLLPDWGGKQVLMMEIRYEQEPIHLGAFAVEASGAHLTGFSHVRGSETQLAATSCD